MATITIPKNFITNDDLVIIPRKQYESFLNMGKKWMQRLSEEQDTDEATDIYKKEKKEGKLKVLKSKSLLFASESSLSKDWFKEIEEKTWQNL